MVDIEIANVTPTGDWDMTGGDVKVPAPSVDTDAATKKYVDDEVGSTVTPSSTTTFTNKTIDDFSNLIHADTLHDELRNESGGGMVVGDAVFISGYSIGLNVALVDFADNGSASTMPAVAILDAATLGNNATGHFTQSGRIDNMDTDSWSVGDELYISGGGTTGNTLTNTKPTGTALVQKVAVVLRSHATLGIIDVFGAGRTNDLPNLPSNNIWLGNGSAVPTENNFDTEVSANTDVTDNTTDRHASGSDDQDISGIGTNTTAISLNTTHRGSAGGGDHSDVSTNNSKVSFTKSEIKGVINHGSTGGTGRPTGFDSVEWIGTVEPTNATNDDTWIDTT